MLPVKTCNRVMNAPDPGYLYLVLEICNCILKKVGVSITFCQGDIDLQGIFELHAFLFQFPNEVEKYQLTQHFEGAKSIHMCCIVGFLSFSFNYFF